MSWKPLGAADKRRLCAEISRQVEAASDQRYSPWAKHIIHQCLWFWTADGVSANGRVGRDKIKYDVDALWHSESVCGLTREACSLGHRALASHPKNLLRHEHAVPRQVIVRRILTAPSLPPASLLDVMERCCIGVVLLKSEDATLNAVHRSQSRLPGRMKMP